MNERDITYGKTEFKRTMDPDALDVYRNEVRIGSLQWHKRYGEPSPRVVFDTNGPLLDIPVNLLIDIVSKYDEIKSRQFGLKQKEQETRLA
jgi:hypothetical protein